MGKYDGRKLHKSTLMRIETVKEIVAKYYEKGNHAKSLKVVWKAHVYPTLGICFNTFWEYYHYQLDPTLQEEDKKGDEKGTST